MVVSDIRDGNGAALIDLHGDLAEKILALIPRKRINDVIYFNPQTSIPYRLQSLGKDPRRSSRLGGLRSDRGLKKNLG
jgi:hypothetical protein